MTITAPALRFFELSAAKRDQISQLIRTRQLTDRARRFLELALSAADSQPPAGLRVRYYGDAISVSCDQRRLAELLDCCAKTIQRAIDPDGEFAGFCEPDTLPITAPNGLPGQKLVYVVLLDELAAMPAYDPEDELDALILRHGPHLQSLRDRRRLRLSEACPADVQGLSSPCPSHVQAVSRACPSDVQGLSEPCPADVASLMTHDHDMSDHERMNEGNGFYSNESQEQHEEPAAEAQARQHPQSSGKFRFCEIDPRHLLAIAGEKVPCADGTDRAAPPRQRMQLLDGYLADAIAVGRAGPDDRRMMLAVFIRVARKQLTNKASYLFKCWENRHTKSLLDLTTPADREDAARLIAEVDRQLAGMAR